MNVRLVHLTDIHFCGEDRPAVEAAVAFAQDQAPDLTVVTGDLTLNGLPREFEAAAAWLERLPRPLLVTPGNHDTPYWNFPLRALIPFQRYRRWIGEPARSAFDSPGLRVRAINSARGAQPRLDWSKGAMNLAACGQAAADLGGAPAGALRVFACHHPLIDVAGEPVEGNTHRGAAAAALLAEAGCDLVLTGHVHVPFAVPLQVGDEKTYGVGGGTLSLRLRGTPPSFNLITAQTESVTVVAQGWTGERFEPYRDWTLQRRGAVPAQAASAMGAG